MQVIEQHPYVEQVITPLDGESATGHGLGEDDALAFLEDEIMKIGSLAHTEIDWGKVERIPENSVCPQQGSESSWFPSDCSAAWW